MVRRACSRFLPFLLVVSTRAALAQAPAPTETQVEDLRRITLERATRAAEEGHHEEALTLAQRAGEIRMTPSVRMFITQEQRRLGQNLAALRSAQACLRELRAQPVANGEAIQARCQELFDEAAQRTGTLTLQWQAPIPDGLRVRVAGEEIDRASLPLPINVDAGVVEVECTAPHYLPFRTTVRTELRRNVELSIALQRAAEVPSSPRSSSVLGPVVLLGVGGVSLAASLGLFLGRNAVISSCAVGPSGTETVLLCPEGIDFDNASRLAHPLETGSAVALSLGLASAGAGTLWLLLTPRRSTEENRAFVPAFNGFRLRF